MYSPSSPSAMPSATADVSRRGSADARRAHRSPVHRRGRLDLLGAVLRRRVPQPRRAAPSARPTGVGARRSSAAASRSSDPPCAPASAWSLAASCCSEPPGPGAPPRPRDPRGRRPTRPAPARPAPRPTTAAIVSLRPRARPRRARPRPPPRRLRRQARGAVRGRGRRAVPPHAHVLEREAVQLEPQLRHATAAADLTSSTARVTLAGCTRAAESATRSACSADATRRSHRAPRTPASGAR